MGLYDTYEPVPPLLCTRERCSEPLSGDWQGDYGVNRFEHYTQGKKEHTDPGPLGNLLPLEFYIDNQCAHCQRWVTATCACVDGVWESAKADAYVGSVLSR